MRFRACVCHWFAILVLVCGCHTVHAQGDLNVVFAPSASDGPVRVFTARLVHTMERANPQATAVAVQGDRILTVGSLDDVKKTLADRSFVLDERFKGKVLIPGLIEQHLHPMLGALALSIEVIAIEDWQLRGRLVRAAANRDEYLDRLRSAEQAIPSQDEFLFTWGYHPFWHGEMSRKVLDGISAKRPIVVWHRSCHEFFLNTPALERLAITRESLEGQGEASSQASWERGHFYEKGLELVTRSLLPHMATPARLRSGLEMLVKSLHQSGVTAICEPGAIMTPELLTVYHATLGADTTPFISYFIPDGRTLMERYGEDQALDATEKVAAMATMGKVSFLANQIKLFADGAVLSQLMQMKEGYADGHKGEWIATPQELRAATRLYWDAGYQLHIHVNGDLGLDVVLDALDRCMREAPRYDHRTVIAHCGSATEEQLGRIARLGAIVSANPYYVSGLADRYSKEGLGPERADRMVPLGSMVRKGVPFSLHSDLPVSQARPLFQAWCAVNRITPSGRVADKEQRISVEQALRAITIDAAYSWRMEHEIGSIAPGKIASFTVLEDDPLTVDPLTLKDISIWGTVFEGRLFPIEH